MKNNILMILIIIFILKIIITKYFPKLIYNNYLYLFILSMLLLYLNTNNYNISLFISLSLILLYTIYKYNEPINEPINEINNNSNNNSIKNNILFLLYLIIIYLTIKYYTNFKKYNFTTINFIILIYIFFSIEEYLTHKYIMHCKDDSILSTIFKNISSHLHSEYLATCKKHISHHIEVEPDMSLNNVEFEEGLFMNWVVYKYIVLFSIICIILAKLISNYNISYLFIIVISLILAFIWQYIWNKVHIAMHEYDINYNITKGPHDNGLLKLDLVKDYLYNNHEMHHIQKGEKKGNYNVIILGADEWFGLNNKVADNIEYCKTHKEEKICKE
jgi:hypothetical protein